MRSRKEIDAQYAHVALIYGDIVFKIEKLSEQKAMAKQELDKLHNEPCAPEAEAPIFCQPNDDQPLPDAVAPDAEVAKVELECAPSPEPQPAA